MAFDEFLAERINNQLIERKVIFIQKKFLEAFALWLMIKCVWGL